MLRLTTQQSEETKLIILEGRIAGRSSAETGRIWTELAPLATSLKLSIGECNMTHQDRSGFQIACSVYFRMGTGPATGNIFTKYLAEGVTRASATQNR